jgi:hypothetical protein
LIKTVRRMVGILALGLSMLAVSLPSAAFAADAGPAASASPVAAGTTRPDTAIVCTTGSSSGNVTTCMSWSNSGTHIEDILGSATVNNKARTIKVCIRSNVNGTLACDHQGYILIRPGERVSALWAPKGTEPAGTYCVRTWRKNNNGSVTLIGEVCTVIAPDSSASHSADGTARSDPIACTTGSSSGNVTTCMSWSASGATIKYIDGTAEVNSKRRTIKICVHSSVVGPLKCNPAGYIPVSPGGHISADWPPNRSEPAASYCVRTWRKNNNDTVTLIGELCTSLA